MLSAGNRWATNTEQTYAERREEFTTTPQGERSPRTGGLLVGGNPVGERSGQPYDKWIPISHDATFDTANPVLMKREHKRRWLCVLGRTVHSSSSGVRDPIRKKDKKKHLVFYVSQRSSFERPTKILTQGLFPARLCSHLPDSLSGAKVELCATRQEEC